MFMLSVVIISSAPSVGCILCFGCIKMQIKRYPRRWTEANTHKIVAFMGIIINIMPSSQATSEVMFIDRLIQSWSSTPSQLRKVTAGQNTGHPITSQITSSNTRQSHCSRYMLLYSFRKYCKTVE